MLKKAELVRSLKEQVAQCRVCEHFCVLSPGQWGRCGVRVNLDGVLYLAVYGDAVAVHIDPIEKKPLFHFLPGSASLSIGTYGCNMRCRWCQNWELSQVREVEYDVNEARPALSPERIVETAIARGCASISYTYNEPTIFFEYTYDTAVLAHERGIKNVYVSNGFMSQEALQRIEPYLDAINVDLKGFTDDLYERYTGARLGPVKRNIATIARDTDIWIEVTTLIIPGLNDSEEELRAAAAWLASVDPDMPWHISAFHPSYQMFDRPRTGAETLNLAYDIGKEAGLNHVYVGNVLDVRHESTYCPRCEQRLIERYGMQARVRWKTPGVCTHCGIEIAGVWK